MATEKTKTEQKTIDPIDPMSNVQIKLFKDSGKYKDPLFVSVNDYRAVIPRGQVVTIPYYVAKHLEEMFAQDENTSALISKFTGEYEERAKYLS